MPSIFAGLGLSTAHDSINSGESPNGREILFLIDGLGAEVADVKEIGLTAADEFTHRVDPLTLETVVRTHGEVKLLDRCRQLLSDKGVSR